jgi:hypothetical protein
MKNSDPFFLRTGKMTEKRVGQASICVLRFQGSGWGELQGSKPLAIWLVIVVSAFLLWQTVKQGRTEILEIPVEVEAGSETPSSFGHAELKSAGKLRSASKVMGWSEIFSGGWVSTGALR